MEARELLRQLRRIPDDVDVHIIVDCPSRDRNGEWDRVQINYFELECAEDQSERVRLYAAFTDSLQTITVDLQNSVPGPYTFSWIGYERLTDAIRGEIIRLELDL